MEVIDPRGVFKVDRLGDIAIGEGAEVVHGGRHDAPGEVSCKLMMGHSSLTGIIVEYEGHWKTTLG